MAYDIHIFRGTEWTDGADDMYTFGKAVFMLDDGMITVACRNEDVPDVMRPVAEALGAVIQGDEGEYY